LLQEVVMTDAAPMHELHQLVLVPLTRNAWRLCDRAVDSHDADSVVAYVELCAGGAYEVAWLWAGFGVEKFRSLEAVLRAAFRRLSIGEDFPHEGSPTLHLVDGGGALR
jgi:hypothetical protein